MKHFKRGLSLVLTLVMVFSLLQPLNVAAEGTETTDLTPDIVNTAEVQYGENAVYLVELEAKMQLLLEQVLANKNHINTKLKSLNLINIPGIAPTITDIAEALVFGKSATLYTIPGGASTLNNGLFSSYTGYEYALTTGLFGVKAKVPFIAGIINETTIDGQVLAGQSLEAQLAAQDLAIYKTEATCGFLYAMLALANNMEDTTPIELVDSIYTFLTFDAAVMKEKVNHLKSLLVDVGPVKLSGKSSLGSTTTKTVTISISDVFDSLYGKFDNNSLLPISLGTNTVMGLAKDQVVKYLGLSEEQLAQTVESMGFLSSVLHGQLLDKYKTVDFTDGNQGLDTILALLIDDLTSAKKALLLMEDVKNPLGQLMQIDDLELVTLLSLLLEGDDLSQGLGVLVDEILEANISGAGNLGIGAILSNLFKDYDFNNLDINEVIGLLDKAIESLELIRLGMGDIEVGIMIQLAKDIYSGDILYKYLTLNVLHIKDRGMMVRYVQNDIKGITAILQSIDIVNDSVAPLFGGKTAKEVVTDYLAVTLPGVINEKLSELSPDIADYGIGECLTNNILVPVIDFVELEPLIEYLICASNSLNGIIEVYDYLEDILEFNENGNVIGIDIWAILNAHGITKEQVSSIFQQAIDAHNQAMKEIYDAILAKHEKNREFLQSIIDSCNGHISNIKNTVADIKAEVQQFKDHIAIIDQEIQDFYDWAQKYMTKAAAEQMRENFIAYCQSEIQSAYDNSGIAESVEKIGYIRTEIKNMIHLIIYPQTLTIIAEKTDIEGTYLIKTNYDFVFTSLNKIMSSLNISFKYSIDSSNPNFTLDNNQLISNADLGEDPVIIDITYSLVFNFRILPSVRIPLVTNSVLIQKIEIPESDELVEAFQEDAIN